MISAGCSSYDKDAVDSDKLKIPIVCNEPNVLVEGDCCLDENKNFVCDNNEENKVVMDKPEINANTAQPQTPDKPNDEIKESMNGLPARKFTIEELEGFINNLTEYDYPFSVEDNNEPYVTNARRSGETFVRTNKDTKYWVIHIINNSDRQLESIDDFYNFVRSPAWQGWKYYINETSWGWLYKSLDESELNELLPKYSYKDYTHLDSNWIDYDVYETPVTTPMGTILRYRMETMIFDKFGYWDGNWENYKLIYKVPCTKDVVVYLRPRWGTDFGQISHINQKKETANKNWLEDIRVKEPDIAEQASAIMDFCGIGKDIFEGTSFKSYEYHDKLVNNWHVYFRVLFNYTFDVEYSIKKGDYEGEYKIKDINITFVPYDANDLLTQDYVSVKIQIDYSGNIIDYADQFIKGGRIKVGEVVHLNLQKEIDVRFGKNASLIFMPYLGWEEVAEPKRYYFGSPIVLKIYYSSVE